MRIIDHTRQGRVAALAALSLLVMSGVVACGGDEQASATSFTREPVDEPSTNPFMEGVDTAPTGESSGNQIAIQDPEFVSEPAPSDSAPSDTAPSDTGASDETTPDTAAEPDAETDDATVVPPKGVSGEQDGDTPGLYGGTRNSATCDATKMATFLDADPAMAEAWAGVLDISADEIPQYIALLTPAVLRTDTAVTNHGYRNGAATSIPAVLQAGTAVLVNQYGMPAVKCSCGNPLTPPAPRRDTTYTGRSWRGFSDRAVVEVRPSSEPLNDLVMVDTSSNSAFERPVGTDGDADVPYTPEGGDGSEGDTTPTTPTTTSSGPSDDATSTSTSTPAASDPTTTTSAAPGGTTTELTATVKPVSGDCVGEEPSTIRAQVVDGRTIVFPDQGGASGPIQPDGTFDFTITMSPPGLPGGTATYRYAGRVDPPRLSLDLGATIDGPTGRVFTCALRSPEIASPSTTTVEATTTTGATTTTTTTSTTEAARPAVQTWYFDARIDSVAPGCEALGITIIRTPLQRLRVRDSGDGNHTITFIGRPSRTLAVDDDGMFSGELFAAGADQLRVVAGGGPVPSLGESGQLFPFGERIGEVGTAPGTFSVTGCTFDATAHPLN